MITSKSFQIRLHLFAQSIHGPIMITCALALVCSPTGVRAHCESRVCTFYTLPYILRYGYAFWLTSLSSQNSPSEPKCRKLQDFWVLGMCQNAGQPPTLFCNASTATSSLHSAKGLPALAARSRTFHALWRCLLVGLALASDWTLHGMESS